MMDQGAGAVQFDPYTYPGAQHLSLTDGYLVTVLAIGFFFVVNYILYLLGPPKKVSGDLWRWRNTFVSWIHANIVGLGVLYCLYFKPEVLVDMVIYSDMYMYALVSFSLGYFLYDFLDHILNQKVVANYEVILHHIWVILLLSYSIQYRVLLAYIVISLTVEINSIFLHARKLMQFDQWPFEHWLYRLVATLNLLTFIRFRLHTIYFIVVVSLPKEWPRITVTYQVYVTVSMFCMTIINLVLFWRIFKNDVIRPFMGPKFIKKQQKNMADKTGNKFTDFHQMKNSIPDHACNNSHQS